MFDGCAALTASLLNRKARPTEISRPSAGSLEDEGSASGNDQAAAFASLFLAKGVEGQTPRFETRPARPLAPEAAARPCPISSRRRRHGRADPPPARVSLRITPQQYRSLQLAAEYLEQSQQAFLAQALDQHIDRVARAPGNGGLFALLQREGG